MASISVRKDTGKLFLDFRFRNIRCREQTELKDTPTNRKRAQNLLDRVQAEIMLGLFDYRSTFPNSSNLQKLEATASVIASTVTQLPHMEAFADLWFNENKVLWRKSYTNSVTNIIEGRIIPFFKGIPVDQITKQQVLAFRTHICKLKKKNGDLLSPTHVNRHMKLLRAILLEAADRFAFTSCYRGIKPLKVAKSDINPFTIEEINLILANCREDFREYFLIRFFTGMRTAEVDGLKWKYVDFANRRIHIRETLVEGEVTYTKNDSSQREIYMSEPVYNAFLLMKLRTQKFEYVFVNRAGNPLDHNGVTKRVWYPLLRALQLPKRNPYQMRHTTATLWLASGESPEWIANQMGHSNTEMLFRVYSRYVPNLTRKDGSAIESMLERVLTSDEDKGDEYA
ncbi:Arm DNA-binding domain-containing protein [Flavobacterium sp. W21_SRS_FM6]|uniref:Arm DNA-binding domain-containing protein n=1 Tax=Flavobacterium sp. W21_SRS_FM6 TaxID=3240268 RepID=UPI003F906D20